MPDTTTPVHQTTIVVPVWNEGRRLREQAFTEFLARYPRVSLLFVNDGSTDDSAERLDRIAAGSGGAIAVLHLPCNVGKGEAVRQGLLSAMRTPASAIGYLDADLAAPLESMLVLEAALASHPEVLLVLGSRVKLLGWEIHRSERRHYLGRVFATFASLTLALPVYDTQCGAKLIRNGPGTRPLLDRPFVSRWLFDVELIARCRDAAGPAAMHEVPLPQWIDREGSSLRWRDWVAAPWQLFRIWRQYPPRRGAS